MKKMTSAFIFVHAFSLIAAVSLLIFKSRISEGNYLVAQLVLFEYGVLTGMLFFTPRFTISLLKKIFKNTVVANPEDFPEGSTYWWIIAIIVLFLNNYFNMTLIIPIAVIIQSSCILFKLIIVYKTLSLTDSQE